MARSRTRSAMLGATTLIMAISARAALLPTLSIMSAAFNVSRRAWSISIRESAISARIVPWSAMGPPKATRDPPPRHMAAAPLPQQDVRHRHAHVFESHLGVPVGRVVITEHAEHAIDGHAGRIHRNQD